MLPRERAVVLLSGGLDSSTALAVAHAKGLELYALSFRYGQTHAREMLCAAAQARHFGVSEHLVLDIDMQGIGGTSLVAAPARAPVRDSPIPATYVPARNTIFLAFALSWAEVLGAQSIYIGVNAVDYSGYPDCRPEFVAAFEDLARVATRAGVEGRSALRIEAPLLALSKAEIVALAVQLGVDLAHTHSCYFPDDAGRACGACDSCRLRLAGFEKAGLPDPVAYRPLAAAP